MGSLSDGVYLHYNQGALSGEEMGTPIWSAAIHLIKQPMYRHQPYSDRGPLESVPVPADQHTSFAHHPDDPHYQGIGGLLERCLNSYAYQSWIQYTL